MKKKRLTFKTGFRVAFGTKHSQAAEMVLAPGDKEGGPENKHKGSDQWLFVVHGHGYAHVNGRRYRLETGSLILIEKGDIHEVGNDSKENLCTLNFYVPPAYKKNGTRLPRGRAS